MSSHESEVDNYSSARSAGPHSPGFMLILIGVMDIIQGLVELVNDEFYVIDDDWVAKFDITTWGWIHLILGIVLMASVSAVEMILKGLRCMGEVQRGDGHHHQELRGRRRGVGGGRADGCRLQPSGLSR